MGEPPMFWDGAPAPGLAGRVELKQITGGEPHILYLFIGLVLLQEARAAQTQPRAPLLFI